MKIGYLYDAVHPWETGGVQKRVWELSRRLAGDHDVHWFGFKYWDGPRVIEREGVTLHGVATPGELYVDGRRSIPQALRFSARLFRPLLGTSFDVIDCQEFPYFPAFPAKLQSVARGSTLLMTWHEVWADYWYDYLGWKGGFGKTVEQLTARLPDAHLTVSTRTRRDLSVLGIKDAKLLPNGVDRAEIASVEPASEPVDVLFVGRLIPEKGADLLLRAIDGLWAEGTDRRCVVVGDGPQRAHLESMITERGLADVVELRGRVAGRETVLGLMKAASVLALPSRREGFGITALEALACGTPVVTIEHPQNAAVDLVDDGVTGIVCEETASAFAAGIDNARTCSRTACQEAAGAYEWSTIVDRAERIYEAAAP